MRPAASRQDPLVGGLSRTGGRGGLERVLDGVTLHRAAPRNVKGVVGLRHARAAHPSRQQMSDHGVLSISFADAGSPPGEESRIKGAKAVVRLGQRVYDKDAHVVLAHARQAQQLRAEEG